MSIPNQRAGWLGTGAGDLPNGAGGDASSVAGVLERWTRLPEAGEAERDDVDDEGDDSSDPFDDDSGFPDDDEDLDDDDDDEKDDFEDEDDS